MGPTTRTHRRPPRPGFTLVEILAVLGIIAILFALAGAAYQRVRITQMTRATEDIVGKLQGGIDDQLKVIADETRLEAQRKSNDFSGLRSYCGDDERAMALLCYCRVRQNFPQTAAEIALGGFNVGGVAFRYDKAFAPLGTMGGTADQQAAAILYVALSQRTLYGKTFASDEVTSGAQTDIVVGGGSVRAYKDPWGNPVVFRRFHTSAELNAPPYSKPGSTTLDPFDPGGKLAGWNGKGTAETTLGTSINNSNKTVVVYSFGRNGAFDNFDLDDVVGYRLRSIGKKGALAP